METKSDILSRLQPGYEYIPLIDLTPEVIEELRKHLNVQVLLRDVIEIGKRVIAERDAKEAAETGGEAA